MPNDPTKETYVFLKIMKCRKCEIYFASKPEILCMSNLGDAMFYMKDTKNLKKN